jgi:hypothetical protein
LDNVSCHSAENHQSCHLLSRIVGLKRKNLILCVDLYERETWSPSLGEEHKFRVLRKVFEPKTEEVRGENCMMRSFMV